MKLVFGLLKGFAIVVVALIAIAFLLPSEVSVSRSIQISAPAADIFPHVNSMQATEAWSPWLSRDPNVELTYEGPEDGVGNTLRWSSDEPSVGTGIQVITASTPNERVETALDFGPQGLANAYFDLEPADGGTLVTWGFDTKLGMNPFARWMGLMFDSWIGADYEKGLANLKALVEAG
ncbi:Polyketide cyclase / dehydrase and lipid transport [Aliiroseovarius sediminilitoris]|uniref:Polyketide cyclase / dehydrase and lipid transport n=1 Tax=Aliiroseovarius sediminilitoris TaxID=1173584 RepID=A0A1I0QVX9_9RHOB|nr:SRPBCC family protein [Aliiroseovarius sediminilitoris]SEW31162.1 Polyketide cyclase / dehydrase and lipid transport [Aliiroseovarius sediminilitoris]